MTVSKVDGWLGKRLDLIAPDHGVLVNRELSKSTAQHTSALQIIYRTLQSRSRITVSNATLGVKHKRMDLTTFVII